MPKFDDFEDENTPNTPPAAANPPADPPPPANPAPNPGYDLEKRLSEISAERDALRQRLESLSAGSRGQQSRIDELEKSIKGLAEANKKPAGPTAEEVIGALNDAIAETEAALEEAEAMEPAKAAPLRRKLRGLERQYTQVVTEHRLSLMKAPDPDELVTQTAEQARAHLAYEAAKAKILADYPQLDGDGEAPDIKFIEQVYDVYQPMIRGGADPAKSLEKSVKMVAKMLDIEPVAAKTPAEPKEPAADKPDTKQTRKQSAIDRNIEAANAQPPDISKAGQSAENKPLLEKYKFGQMSIEDFMRIPDEEQAKIEEAMLRYEPAEE